MKKLTICTYALVRGYIKIKDYKSLIKRNRLIRNNIEIKKHKIDHILFHEGNIKRSHQAYIKKKFNLKIKFINLKKILFNFKSKDKILHLKSKTSDDTLGYKYMCMFHTYLSFQYLKKYDFCMRIDEDIFIHSKINDEFYDYIYKKKLKYIFYRKKFEYHDVTNRTLYNYVNRYYKKRKYIVDLYNKENALPNFSTSFTIFNPAIFLKKKIHGFLKKIYYSNNIIKYRWGDHTLQGLALILFTNSNSWGHLKDIKLLHGSQYYVPTKRSQNFEAWTYKCKQLNFDKKYKNFSYEFFFYTYLYGIIQFIKKNKLFLKYIRYLKAKLEK